MNTKYAAILVVTFFIVLGYLSNYYSVTYLRTDIEEQKRRFGSLGKHGGEMNIKANANIPYIVEWWITENANARDSEFYCGQHFMFFGYALHTLRSMDPIDFSR